MRSVKSLKKKEKVVFRLHSVTASKRSPLYAPPVVLLAGINTDIGVGLVLLKEINGLNTCSGHCVPFSCCRVAYCLLSLLFSDIHLILPLITSCCG